MTVRAKEFSIGFSGDLGRQDDPVFHPPEPLEDVDYLVLESTYGDRLHPKSDPLSELGQIIRQVAKRGGVILVPAFTVGRAQVLLYFLTLLKQQNAIPNIPMYLNSPMASHVGEAFVKYRSLHKLSMTQCQEMMETVRTVETVDESKALNDKSGPMLIISASGMATGGRILHHLKAFAPDPKNAIILTGFQAAGTRGEALLNQVDEIKIHGQMVPVRAEVYSLENLSAHADYSEILTWLRAGALHPQHVFVTHGEFDAAKSLASRIHQQLEWTCSVPEPLQVFSLNPRSK